jgi:plastocyanin
MRRLAGFSGIVLTLLAIGSAALAATKQVAINDSNFSPATVEITTGDTVTWTPKGTAPHTVTAKDGSFNSDSSGECQSSHYKGCLIGGSDDSPEIKKSFSHTFTKVGTVGYTCKVHGFSGTVIVKAPAPTPKPATPAPAPTAAPIVSTQPTVVPTEAPASTSPSSESTPTPTATLGTAEPLAVDESGKGSNTGVLVGAIVGGLALAGAAGGLIFARMRRPV